MFSYRSSGMGFRPQPDVERTLVQFQQGKEGYYDELVENIDDLIKGN